MHARWLGLSVFGLLAACHGSVEATSTEAQAEAALVCPPSVALGVSALALETTFDLGNLAYDCEADRLMDSAESACTDYYAREVEEVADELRALPPIEVTLERAPTLSTLATSCRYVAPSPVAGHVNAIEIRRDHGELSVSAAYTPVRPHTFGNVYFDASVVRVTAQELVLAEGPATITDATGPYSYSYVEMGTATLVSR